MTTQDVLRYRLYNQQLALPKFTTPLQIVSWLGAVQSQDYSGAKWAVAQRIVNATDESIEKAFNEGTILRTHVMRPTWHFVAPDDVRWLLQLTAPRIKTMMGYYNRKLGLTEDVFKQTQIVLQKTLTGGKAMTREELGSVLQKAHLPGLGQALGHIAMGAELDGVICSGPRRGKQFTYMLLEERVPKSKSLDRDEALAELTKRYFTSHGPATLKDFAWWSGLTVADGRRGIEKNSVSLANETIEGITYWFATGANTDKPMPKVMYLLPNYDENAIAYKDRNIFFNPADTQHLDSRGNMIFQHMIMFEGKIIGLWRRTLKKESVIIESRLFKKIANHEEKLLHEAFNRYGKFLNKRVLLE